MTGRPAGGDDPSDRGRREFLRRGGVAAAGAAALALGPAGATGAAAEADTTGATGAADAARVRTVCTHCAVGCSFIAEVTDGEWTGIEPDFDNPLSLGGLCARGVAARGAVLDRRRLPQPMKLEGGRWKTIDWTTALAEVGDALLGIRHGSGPDSVYWWGSGGHSNEQAYLLRKLAAFWGTNNIDHESRLFHAGGDFGLTRTWGTGAATNVPNDIRNARSIIVFGGSPAEDQPLSMQHILRAKERNAAPLVVCDARVSRTAARADEHVRNRPGTDVALVWGLLNRILDAGLEDRDFLRARVTGFRRVRAEAARWTPEETERVTGVAPAQLERVARLIGGNSPGALIWTTPGSQAALGSAAIRAFAALQLALGNLGVAGGGVNAFRLTDNAQGVADMGVSCDTLPGYLGLDEGAWRHWARVWGVPYEWLGERFNNRFELMQRPGIAGSRWFDAVTGETAPDQPDRVRGLVAFGEGLHLAGRPDDMRAALAALDVVVAIGPWPGLAALAGEREDGVFLLPSTTQYESAGSVTSMGRSIQWRQPVMAPRHNARTVQEIVYLMAAEFGFADAMFSRIAVDGYAPEPDSVFMEARGGLWSIGMGGHTPERLRRHMANQHTFDRDTLRARGGPVDGEYYGLPWPCWGPPEAGHPGTPVLFDTSRHVMDGGSTFPAPFGPEHEGRNLLAEQSYTAGSDIKDGYPPFTAALIRLLNWDGDLTAAEQAAIVAAGDGADWRTDTSGAVQRIALAHGCVPWGNGKARVWAWELDDAVPAHREPIYTSRRDLVEPALATGPLYAAVRDGAGRRLPMANSSIASTDHTGEFPLIAVTGRSAVHGLGGEATRRNLWLIDLMPDGFAEISPRDANNAGLRDGEPAMVYGPGGAIRVRARVTDRVPPGLVWLPLGFGGVFPGGPVAPERTAAPVTGDAATNLAGYGYDPSTETPEILCGLCRVTPAPGG